MNRDKQKVIFIITVALLAALAFPSLVLADNLTSGNYWLHMSTINIDGGRKTSTSYTLTDTMGQTAPGRFTSNGYIVRSGFQYIYTTFIPFTFAISKLGINFTNLIPGAAQTDSNTLTVRTGSAFGYAVTAIEDHALTLENASTTIPNTACDTGTPCTISAAAPWTTTTAYGFGYNASGTDVNAADFVNNTYYKPFANAAASQTPVVVAQRSGVATQSAVTTVTYRLNIRSTQAAGLYENNIQFIATPAY